ncbi:MAG: 4-hydroxy-tetrahydrodipicolinate reductase, partial [Burkholderiales bacterium]
MRIVIAGASGRMGRSLIEGVLADPALALAGAIEAPGNPRIGQDATDGIGAASVVRITDNAATAVAAGDCVIDFTVPAATLEHVAACEAAGRAIVIGTTGFDDAGKARIAEAAKRIPIVMAPNMAVGVNATFKLAETAARILGEGYDIEIIEAHHRHKIDAPSGTALRLGEVVATALGRDLAAESVHGREGITGERRPSAIGFHAIRGGDIVGEHTVMFAGPGERIEIT